jgi:hypothetical protein
MVVGFSIVYYIKRHVFFGKKKHLGEINQTIADLHNVLILRMGGYFDRRVFDICEGVNG